MLDSGFNYKVCAMDHKMLGFGDTNYRYYVSPVEYMHTVTIQGGPGRGRNQQVDFQCEDCIKDHNVYETLVYFSTNCSEELVPYARLNMSSPQVIKQLSDCTDSWCTNLKYRVKYTDFSTTLAGEVKYEPLSVANIDEFLEQYDANEETGGYDTGNYSFVIHNDMDQVEFYLPYNTNYSRVEFFQTNLGDVAEDYRLSPTDRELYYYNYLEAGEYVPSPHTVWFSNTTQYMSTWTNTTTTRGEWYPLDDQGTIYDHDSASSPWVWINHTAASGTDTEFFGRRSWGKILREVKNETTKEIKYVKAPFYRPPTPDPFDRYVYGQIPGANYNKYKYPDYYADGQLRTPGFNYKLYKVPPINFPVTRRLDAEGNELSEEEAKRLSAKEFDDDAVWNATYARELGDDSLNTHVDLPADGSEPSHREMSAVHRNEKELEKMAAIEELQLGAGTDWAAMERRLQYDLHPPYLTEHNTQTIPKRDGSGHLNLPYVPIGVGGYGYVGPGEQNLTGQDREYSQEERYMQEYYNKLDVI